MERNNNLSLIDDNQKIIDDYINTAAKIMEMTPEELSISLKYRFNDEELLERATKARDCMNKLIEDIKKVKIPMYVDLHTGEKDSVLVDASENISGEKPKLVIDIDKYMMDYPEHCLTPSEEYELPSEEEMARRLGLTPEEYREQLDRSWKNFDEKMQSFIKTGNPVGVWMDLDGNILGEIHRTVK